MALAGYITDSLATLAAAGAACFGLLWVAKRLGPARSGGPLRLEGELALGARRSVYLIRAGEKVFLVGASETGLSPLGELDGATVPRRDERSETTDFATFLRRLGKSADGRPEPSRPTSEGRSRPPADSLEASRETAGPIPQEPVDRRDGGAQS
jgi:flagellar biogenesis protein FliO